ncbi:hypothetical protein JXB27_03075 [Candidatus Woesearchaeota archaeon]|nr:hypothetical protein [Candidatus Woesearchaeota archaeon]
MKGLENLLKIGRTAVLAGGLAAAANGAMSEPKYVEMKGATVINGKVYMQVEDNSAYEAVMRDKKIAKSCYLDAKKAFDARQYRIAENHITTAFNRWEERVLGPEPQPWKNLLIKVYKAKVKQTIKSNGGNLNTETGNMLKFALECYPNVNDGEFLAMAACNSDDNKETRKLHKRAFAANKAEAIKFYQSYLGEDWQTKFGIK